MSYNFIDLRKVSPESAKRYLIDTNVWVYRLNTPIDELRGWEAAYLDFFDKIISFDQSNNPPKIIINSLLISEIINACLNREYRQYKMHFGEISKKEFRELEEYENLLENIQSEIESYRDYIEVVSDDQVNPLDIVQNLQTQIDFNDQFYYEMAYDNNYILITNDKDFIVQDVTILTTSLPLLRL